MPDRTRTDDFSELAQAALEMLGKALNDGDGHHPPGSWKAETYSNQVNHMQGHLFGVTSAKDLEMDLTHLLCRTIMAYALKRGEF